MPTKEKFVGLTQNFKHQKIMELTSKEKELVLSLLFNADGEDMQEIVNKTGFNFYLLHSLIMEASDENLDYLISKRKEYKLGRL